MATRKVTAKVRDQILKKMTQAFGPGYDKRGLANADLKATPTGHDDLDCLLTKGAMGIAKGCIVELMGSEGSGKSSLALRTVGNAQKAGELCCWFDAEAAFSCDLAKINGVKPDELIMPDLAQTKSSKTKKEEPKEEDNPDAPLTLFNVSEVLEMIYKSICTNIYGIIVLDSVAGLMPERILSQDFDPNKAGMAEVARSMAQMLGKIAQACYKTETTCIFINQLREKPGEYYQDRFHTPGGRALKFFAHQRISVEKKGGKDGLVFEKDLEGNQNILGHYARTTIVKNRMAPPVPPNVSIEIPIYYVQYNPDDAKKCYDLARSLQIITNRLGILTWKDGDEVICKIEGEGSLLSQIREQALEPQLAAQCVKVAAEEKNMSKKQPTRIPTTIQKLADAHVLKMADMPQKATKAANKKVSKSSQNLNDEI